MKRIVPVKFYNAGRHYDFNAQSFELIRGSQVVVETDRGRALATVVTTPREVADEDLPKGLKNVLRIATEEDVSLASTNTSREKEAIRYCQGRILDRQMEMKLVKAEYAFDGSKIIFFFTADGRVDFRELVKDLAHYFHTRIEMRQIGVRDEAKMVGGLGICGRELCCCSFLTEFAPVSVKMAKEQGLALNPTKISGQCGRLLCCLGYEYETYSQLKKGMPKCGKKVLWQGETWEVSNQNPLEREITLRQPGGTYNTISMDEFEKGKDVAVKEQTERTEENRPQSRPSREQGSGRRRSSDRSQKQRTGQQKDGQKQRNERKQTDKQQPKSDKPKERRASAEQKPQKQKPQQQKPQQQTDTAAAENGGPSKSRRRRRNRRRGGRRPRPENKGE